MSTKTSAFTPRQAMESGEAFDDATGVRLGHGRSNASADRQRRAPELVAGGQSCPR